MHRIYIEQQALKADFTIKFPYILSRICYTVSDLNGYTELFHKELQMQKNIHQSCSIYLKGHYMAQIFFYRKM